MTIPRLHGLVKAYGDRRRDELHLLGRVVNLAVTNPKEMEKVFGDGARQAGDNEGVQHPDADYTKWWGEE